MERRETFPSAALFCGVDVAGTVEKALPKETGPAKRAWADFLALGPGASYRDLIAKYATTKPPKNPPTRSLDTIKRWAADFGWQERREKLFDAEREEVETLSVATHLMALRRLAAILQAPGHIMPDVLIKTISAVKPPTSRSPVEINVKHGGNVTHKHYDLSRFDAEERLALDALATRYDDGDRVG